MKKVIAMIVLTFSVTGCATIEVTPPSNPNNAERSRVYKLPFEKVWTRTVDWYADHNVIIDKIEKQSGLLTAKYLLESSDADLSCGEINAYGTYHESITKNGSLNVTVRALDDNETKVTVNFFGEFVHNARDNWDGRPVITKGNCISTGNIEKSILNYIHP